MSVALLHVRQSRTNESQRTTSPQVQEKECRDLEAVKACDVVEVYVDLDKSGKNVAKRPGFQKFLQRLQDEPPAVDAVYDSHEPSAIPARPWTSTG